MYNSTIVIVNEIVIDASCILEYLLNQSEKNKVLLTVGTARLVAPNCIPFEIGNAISKLIKRSLISIYDGVSVYHEFARIPIRLVQADIPNAIVIAGESQSYAYDAYYISIAKQLSLPLYTMDETMKSNASARGIVCL